MLVRYNAPAAIDATGLHIAPASLLLHVDRLHADDEAPESSRSDSSSRHPTLPPNTLHANLRVEALATPTEIDAHLRALGATPARTIKIIDAILTPALVNAHTHLDLTHIGPQPFDPAEGFTGFIRLVLSRRLSDEQAIRESVKQGAALSLRGGVAAVGDIAGVVAGKPSLFATLAMLETPLKGVSFVEFFGMGANASEQLAALATCLQSSPARALPEAQRSMIGVQPHAPYTVSSRLYDETHEMAEVYAAENAVNVTGMLAWSLRVSTHLAETPEEHEFIAKGTGPFRAFLERVGWWQDSLAQHFGNRDTPVQHWTRTGLGSSWPTLLAHVNDCSDADIEWLRALPEHTEHKHSIAYCPRSSSYFRNHEHFGPHRYRDMLAAGINVCLGTDSVINLPNAHRLSTLDEARFLFARDGFDPRELLAMATIRGARALGLPETAFRFSQGDTLAGLLAIPVESDAHNPWEAILRSTDDPQLIALHSQPL
jgi:cytosine/adenosine deaminase-related metal-dependent hydrolase